MSARWWTLGVWALAAGSVLYWGLKVFVTPLALPPQTQSAAPTVALRGDLSRLLGAEALLAETAPVAEAAADARFELIGVVSPRSPRAAREGVALIAVDGKPPRAYRVGAVVDGNHVLQSVAARGVELGPRDGAALVSLKLAPPAPAATGVLPGAVGQPDGAAPPPLRPQLNMVPMRPPPTPNYRPVPPVQAEADQESSSPNQQEQTR